MAEVTNKTLAILLVCAIIISLGGTIVSINRLTGIGVTGFAAQDTDSGYVNFTVTQNVQIEFDDNQIDFLTGYATGATPCTMSINASEDGASAPHVDRLDGDGNCGGSWADFSGGSEYPLVIENYGNVDLNVSVTSDKGTAQFIGGTNDAFQWTANLNETGSCNQTANTTDGEDDSIFNNWVNIGAADEQSLCPNLTWASASNSIALGFKVTIPQDTTVTRGVNQTATITVLGKAITT